ncbi:MAG: glutamine-hydrolyzing carbamoyl-phosphate synthase small subunit [Ignavibacteria bacterium]|nr:glutamine-hydrolyzing carbamoyl-phosphate synthase small subunit [Ignavibacteria bacterium]
MRETPLKDGKLILENGEIFEGKIFGCIAEASGEVVFNTSLCGYQEILTDPSYYGQIVIMTYPLIGNYGTNNEDCESEKVQAKGLIVGSYEDEWSNFEGMQSLNDYLKKNNVTAVAGIDTRALTKMVRTQGSMRGIITGENISEKKLLQKVLNVPEMSGANLVPFVTANENYIVSSENPKYKIAVYDFGIKKNILREFLKFDVELKVFKADCDYKEILDYKPDGIFFSNGPGDPAAVTYGIENAKNLIPSGVPVFGICLGHQLISLALGAQTYKLKFGHRGGNHPVKNHDINKIEITSQNHGFAVNEKTFDNPDIVITHTNLYDGTNEGIRHKKYPVMSVQYHPEASPGPNDSKYLFTEFMKIVSKN